MKSKNAMMRMDIDDLEDYLNTLTDEEWSFIVSDARKNGYEISAVLDWKKRQGSRFQLHRTHWGLYERVMNYFGFTFEPFADGLEMNKYPEELRNATYDEIREYYKRQKDV